MNLAHEIARAAVPACESLTDEQLREVVDRKMFRAVLGYYPSPGEVVVLDAARALAHLVERCDSHTVGLVLETVDRFRARMVGAKTCEVCEGRGEIVLMPGGGRIECPACFLARQAAV